MSRCPLFMMASLASGPRSRSGRGPEILKRSDVTGPAAQASTSFAAVRVIDDVPACLGASSGSVGEYLGERPGRYHTFRPCVDLLRGCRRDALLDWRAHRIAEALPQQ